MIPAYVVNGEKGSDRGYQDCYAGGITMKSDGNPPGPQGTGEGGKGNAQPNFSTSNIANGNDDSDALIVGYIDAKLALVRLEHGTKETHESGWNRPENAIRTLEQAVTVLSGKCNIGLAHAWSDPPTCAVDIDDLKQARSWLVEHGVDIDALLDAPNAVRIVSPRTGSEKLIYRLQQPIRSCVVKNESLNTILEFRCASKDGLTVQDVLPPSIHPLGQSYRLVGDIAAIPLIPVALLKVWRQKLADQGNKKGAPITDGLPKRFVDLLIGDDALRKRWEGNTEGLDDASRSGLDMSFTSRLVIRGFNNAEIALIHRAFPHGKCAQDGRDGAYISDMIVKTRATRLLARNKPMQTAYRLLAERFTADDGTWLLRHWRNDIYRWDGRAYQVLQEDDVKAVIYSYLNGGHCLGAKDKREPFNPKGTHVNEVLSALCAIVHLEHHHAMPCWLDRKEDDPDPKEVLAMANGLLHLPTRTLHRHNPRFFTSLALPFAYEPQAEPPMVWHRFLHNLWPNDRESIETLQECFGYVLTADTSQQKILLLVGPPRAGKGVIARVQRALLGDANCAAPTLDSLHSHFGLEPLIGKSLAVISDARLGNRADQKVLAERLLTISGQDALTIDRKYKGQWTGTLGVRLMLLTNELPAIEDASGALASRFIVLQLKESWLGREDVGLANRLLQELPGILNWALKGLARLRERGYFRQPATAQKAIQELSDLASPIKVFLREYCVVEPDAMVECGALYQRWQLWCRVNGREFPGTNQQFGKNLRAALPKLEISNLRENGARNRHYVGVRLNTNTEMTGNAEFQQLIDRMKVTKGG